MNDLDELAAAVRQKKDVGSIPYASRHAPQGEYPPCEICGYRGGTIVTSKINWIVVLVLFIFSVIAVFPSFFLAAAIFIVMIFYIVFNLGSVFRCGHCGAKKADA